MTDTRGGSGLRGWSSLAALLFLSAGSVLAQPLASDGRISAGGGVGIVASPASCYFCDSGMWPALSYRFGKTIRYNTVLVLEGLASQWSGHPACSGSGCRQEPDASFFVTAHTLTLQHYPNPERPFFVKVGVGVSVNGARYTAGAPTASDLPVRKSSTVTSLTPKVGFGVERRITPQLSVSMHADAVRAVRGRIAAGDATLSATLLYFGIGVTWYQ